MFVLEHLRTIRQRCVVLIAAFSLFWIAGCPAPAPAPSVDSEAAAPAPAAEEAAAAPEVHTNIAIDWTPFVCNFPNGSGNQSLEITHIEVTQGVQTPDNNLPLVAGRSTAVLAHINAAASLTDTISGQLSVMDENGEAVFMPSARFSASGSSEGRGYIVLVFEPFTVQGSPSVALSVTVTADKDGEQITDTSDIEIPVLKSVQPVFYYTPIYRIPKDMMNEDDLSHYSQLINAPNGDALLRGIIAAPDDNLWRYQPLEKPLGDIDITSTSWYPTGDVIRYEYSCPLLKELADVRENIVTSHIRPSEDNPISVGSIETKFLYGWVYDPGCPGSVVEQNGSTTNGGRVAYGSTTPCKGQHTYAHETLHNLWVEHNSDPVDVCGWDVGARLNLGGGPEYQRKTLDFHRIMAHERTEVSWAALSEYAESMAYLGLEVLHDFVQTLPECNTGVAPCIEQGNYDFQGCINDESELLSFPESEWIYQTSWYSQPTPYTVGDPDRLPYRLVFRSGDREFAEIPFDARTATDPDDGREGVYPGGFFNITVPAVIVNEADSIVIRGEGIDEDIPFRERTEPPTIESIGFESIDEGQLQAFVTVRDPDTDILGCHFSFSPDSGNNWFPIKATLAEDSGGPSSANFTSLVVCTNGDQTVIDLEEMLLPDGFQKRTSILRFSVIDGLNIITEDIEY